MRLPIGFRWLTRLVQDLASTRGSCMVGGADGRWKGRWPLGTRLARGQPPRAAVRRHFAMRRLCVNISPNGRPESRSRPLDFSQLGNLLLRPCASVVESSDDWIRRFKDELNLREIRSQRSHECIPNALDLSEHAACRCEGRQWISSILPEHDSLYCKARKIGQIFSALVENCTGDVIA